MKRQLSFSVIVIEFNEFNEFKISDVTERGSPTISDCHYVKKTIFSLDYCLLSMFSIFWCIIKYRLSFANIVS